VCIKVCCSVDWGLEECIAFRAELSFHHSPVRQNSRRKPLISSTQYAPVDTTPTSRPHSMHRTSPEARSRNQGVSSIHGSEFLGSVCVPVDLARPLGWCFIG
jgi:hypothetical protein